MAFKGNTDGLRKRRRMITRQLIDADDNGGWLLAQLQLVMPFDGVSNGQQKQVAYNNTTTNQQWELKRRVETAWGQRLAIGGKSRQQQKH